MNEYIAFNNQYPPQNTQFLLYKKTEHGFKPYCTTHNLWQIDQQNHIHNKLATHFGLPTENLYWKEVENNDVY